MTPTGAVIHEIELPSGIQFRGPSLPEVLNQYAAHSAASVAEGMCPRHATPMEPFAVKPGLIGGDCRACQSYYALELATGSVHASFHVGRLPPWAA
jgi:hypothetical protein